MPSVLSAIRSRVRRSSGSQAGFTLVELLVSMTLLTAIMAGSMTLLVSMMQKQPGLSDRSEQVAESRVALEGMVREIRPGYAIDSASGTANTVTFRTYIRACSGGTSPTAVLCRVTYTCTPSTGICTRSTANPDGTGATTPRRLIEGVTNADVFTIQPTSIAIKFVIPTEDGGGETTVLDGATMRNATLAN